RPHAIAIRSPCCLTSFPYTTLFRSRDDPTTQSRLLDEPHGAVPTQRVLCRACVEDPVIAVTELERMPGHQSRVLDAGATQDALRSEEHTSELHSLTNLVFRLLLRKK